MWSAIKGRFIFFCVIILGIAVLLARQPLFSDFHYEFAAANAILITFISALYVIHLNRESDLNSPSWAAFESKLWVFLFPLLPLPVILFFAIIDANTGLLYGLPLYCVFVFPAPLIGLSIADITSFTVKRGRYIFCCAALIVIIALPVWELYFNKNVFFYNPLFVFYPGTIYDESISVTHKLVIYRLLNIFYFIFPLKILYLSYTTAKKRIQIAGWAAVGAVFFFASPLFQFSTNEYRLQASFDKVLRTEHCQIYFMSADFDSVEAHSLGILHEVYYNQLKEFFKCEPGIVKSYIFSSPKQKYNLIGAGRADLTKPHQREFYLTASSFMDNLKHEMAHVFSSEFGTTPFRLPSGFNPMLLEGTAVAASENSGYDLDYLAYLALRSSPGFRLNKQLSGFNFFTSSSDLAYTLSGAFCKYLVVNFGIEKFKNFYQAGFKTDNYNKDLDRLENDFIRHITSLPYSNDSALGTMLFKHSTIFQKKCPHLVAALLQDVEVEFQKSNFYTGLEILDRISRFSNEPRVVFLKAFALKQTQREKEAVALMLEFLNKNGASSYAMSARVQLGDILFSMKNLDSAKFFFNSVIQHGFANRIEAISKLRLHLMANSVDFKSFSAATPEYRHGFFQELCQRDSGILSLWGLERMSGSNDSTLKFIRQKVSSDGFLYNENNPVPYLDLAEYCIKRGDLETAEKIMGNAKDKFDQRRRECYSDVRALITQMKKMFAERPAFTYLK